MPQRIVTVPASIHNKNYEKIAVKLDDKFFEKQKQLLKVWEQVKLNFKDNCFDDFIEESPITVDFKINCLYKMQNIAIDHCGVYSYAFKVNKHEIAGNNPYISKEVEKFVFDNPQMAVILNINSKGKQKIINLESNLLF